MPRGVLVLMALVMVQTSGAAPALLSGTVRDALTGQPLRGARTTVLADGRLGTGRIVYTDGDGHFTFDGLPPGIYHVSAWHDRYFEASLGTADFALQQAPVILNPGHRMTHTAMMLIPTSSIAGRVTDERNRPKPKARVFLRQRTVVGGIDWVSSPRERSLETDADGAYRFEGLRPGSYLVGIAWGGAGVPDTSRAYQPVLYPSATRADQATPISLEPGDVREGVDLQLVAVRAHAIFGRVSGPSGGVRGASLRLMQPIAHERPSLEPLDLTAMAATIEGGGFMFKNIVPGSYTLVAAWSDPRLSGRPQEGPAATPLDRDGLWARVPIEIGDADLVDLDVPLQPGLEVRGLLALEGPGSDAPTVEAPQIELVPLSPTSVTPPAVVLHADHGALRANGVVPGLYRLRMMWASGWRIKSVLFGDTNVSTAAFDIKAGSSAELRVTLTSQTSGLFGSVMMPQPERLRDPIVVIYTTNRNDWASGVESTRIQTVPAPNGRFVVDNLDPGDYYVIAVDRADFLTGAGATGFPALAQTWFLFSAEGHSTGLTDDPVTPTRATLERWSLNAATVTVKAGTHTTVMAPLTAPPVSGTIPEASLRNLSVGVRPHLRLRPIGSSIEGTVRDPAGDPAMGIDVLAIRPRLTANGRFDRVGSGRTDRYGHYAIDRLSNGTYVVAVPGWLVGGDARLEGADQTVSRAELFYPGVAEFGRAQPVTLGESEIRDRIDLSLLWTPATAITGLISCDSGTALALASASVRAPGGRLFASDYQAREVDWLVDREYRFAGLLAGRYVIEAHASEARPGDMGGENGRVCWGRLEVELDGRHPVTVPLTLQPGAVVGLLFRFESDRPAENWHWQADLRPVATDLSIYSVPKLLVGDTVVWNGLPAGTFRLNPSVPGWHVTSMTRAGKPFEGPLTLSLGLGDEVRDIVVTLAKGPR